MKNFVQLWLYLAEFFWEWNLEFLKQIFEKYWNIKLHENPSSGSRFVPRGGADVQTVMTKLGDAFRNFSNKLNETKRFWNTGEAPKYVAVWRDRFPVPSRTRKLCLHAFSGLVTPAQPVGIDCVVRMLCCSPYGFPYPNRTPAFWEATEYVSFPRLFTRY